MGSANFTIHGGAFLTRQLVRTTREHECNKEITLFFMQCSRGRSSGLTHPNKKVSALQDPGPSQGSSGSHRHHHPQVLSQATESPITEARTVSGFLGEISAAGVSCCWAFPPSYEIHLPDRQGKRKGSSITTVHFTVSTTIYST